MEQKLNDLVERIGSLEKQMDVLIRLFGSGVETPKPSLTDDKNYVGDSLKYLMGLTPKQTATLQMILRGFSTPEMAEALDASESTAKQHISALFNKFDTRDRATLIIKTQGLFDNVDADDYLRHGGIPKDWVLNYDKDKPDKYTNLIRIRRKIGK